MYDKTVLQEHIAVAYCIAKGIQINVGKIIAEQIHIGCSRELMLFPWTAAKLWRIEGGAINDKFIRVEEVFDNKSLCRILKDSSNQPPLYKPTSKPSSAPSAHPPKKTFEPKKMVAPKPASRSKKKIVKSHPLFFLKRSLFQAFPKIQIRRSSPKCASKPSIAPSQEPIPQTPPPPALPLDLTAPHIESPHFFPTYSPSPIFSLHLSPPLPTPSSSIPPPPPHPKFPPFPQPQQSKSPEPPCINESAAGASTSAPEIEEMRETQ